MFSVMTGGRTRRRASRPVRSRVRFLTPPGSKAREYERDLRRDFGIELLDSSDQELRALAVSHGLRQALVRRVLAGMPPFIAAARRLRSWPRLAMAVRVYIEAQGEFVRREGIHALERPRRRRSKAGLRRLDESDIRLVVAPILWASLKTDILWIYANSVVAEGRQVATSRVLQTAIRTYDRQSRREIARAHDRYDVRLVPRRDPRAQSGKPATTASR
jgi:hypothetical protein